MALSFHSQPQNGAQSVPLRTRGAANALGSRPYQRTTAIDGAEHDVRDIGGLEGDRPALGTPTEAGEQRHAGQ